MPWRSINGTYGVAGAVCLEPGRPSRLPEGLVDALRRHCDPHSSDGEPLEYQAGEDVRIVLGPFADMTARIEAVPAKDRIHVLLDLMGRSVKAQISPKDIERAS